MIPTPTPTPIGADQVTPGWVGFVVTAVFVLIVVALIFDMVRRMRRVRYRAEARDRIAAELDAQFEGGEAPPPDDDTDEDGERAVR